MFSNEHCTLSHYKDSIRGTVKDYVIRFHGVQTCPKQVANIAFSAVCELVNHFRASSSIISGRLVALVQYRHIDHDTIRTYFHPSYSSEVIDDAVDFFFTHMLKIAERMESFNRHGSNLQICGIKEVHIHITVRN